VSIRHRELDRRAPGGAARIGTGEPLVIGIVIVAHGGLAREYLAAVEHVVGRSPAWSPSRSRPTTTAPPSSRRSARPRTRSTPGDGVVVVTDMFGGSPSNLSLRACRPVDRKIVYGANLPLLIKLAKSRHLPLRRPWPKRGGGTQVH
jgi:mannose PTS system EIIA component